MIDPRQINIDLTIGGVVASEIAKQLESSYVYKANYTGKTIPEAGKAHDVFPVVAYDGEDIYVALKNNNSIWYQLIDDAKDFVALSSVQQILKTLGINLSHMKYTDVVDIFELSKVACIMSYISHPEMKDVHILTTDVTDVVKEIKGGGTMLLNTSAGAYIVKITSNSGKNSNISVTYSQMANEFIGNNLFTYAVSATMSLIETSLKMHFSKFDSDESIYDIMFNTMENILDVGSLITDLADALDDEEDDE